MFDPVSIFLVTIVSALLSMGVLGSMLRAQVPGVSQWMLGCGLSIVSMVFLMTQFYGWPRILSVVFANQLLMLGLLVILQGCRRFAGMRVVYRSEYAAWLLALVGLCYWTYQNDDLNARIALVSAFHAYLYFSVAGIAYRIRRSGHSPYAYRFVCVVALIGALAHVLRGVLHATGLLQQQALFQGTAAMSLFLGLGIVALPCLAAGMVMLVHDRLVRRLEHLASVDELTGTLMRSASMREAERALRIAARNGRPLTVAMLDLDRFKAINDSMGHAIGDQVLQHFGQRLGSGLRASDIFGRLGGEEFIIISPETTQAEGVIMLQRMQQRIQQPPFLIDGEPLAYTFSAGVSQFQSGESLAQLLARVDELLYVAKSRGRDCVVEAPPVWLTSGGIEGSRFRQAAVTPP